MTPHLLIYMQNYQLFWNQEIAPGGHRQFVIDWDLFISNFTKAISQHAHYQLNPTQKEFIRGKIDPRHSNQIYKNAFLLFTHNYWDLPSNRTNLFKMKINLTSIPKLSLLTGSNLQKIFISVRYISITGDLKHLKYQLKDTNFHELDSKGFETSQKPLQEKDFLSIGACEGNDLQIEDCYFLNSRHFKLVCLKKQKKTQKKMYFSQKKEEIQIKTEWYIRDVATSNRLKYLLDNPWKYVVAKPGMVMSIGLNDETELRIEKIGFESNSFAVSQLECQEIMNSLNSDRLNFMGEINQSVPLKTVIDMDFYEITAKQIQYLQEQGHYYPEFPSETPQKIEKTDKQESPSVTFSIIDKRTFKTQRYVSNLSCFSIGRSEECSFRIDNVSIRKKEVVFQFISNRWTVRSASDHGQTSLDVNVPSVWIASAVNIDSGRNSNRLRLRQGYPFVLGAKKIDFQIELIQPQEGQQTP